MLTAQVLAAQVLAARVDMHRDGLSHSQRAWLGCPFESLTTKFPGNSGRRRGRSGRQTESRGSEPPPLPQHTWVCARGHIPSTQALTRSTHTKPYTCTHAELCGSSHSHTGENTHTQRNPTRPCCYFKTSPRRTQQRAPWGWRGRTPASVTEAGEPPSTALLRGLCWAFPPGA